MKPPAMVGTIERRALINFRADPEVVRRMLPEPFRPNTALGSAIVGICLIRLGDLRPRGVPAALGVTTENAAHRIAVEWDDDHGTAHGVYIPRRDTSSRLSAFVGGRLFPGEHHRARIDADEHDGAVAVALESIDGVTRVELAATPSDALPAESIFDNVDAASAFFRRDAVGYSHRTRGDGFDGVELAVDHWQLDPLHVDRVASSWFSDSRVFPSGSVVFDSALAMCPTAAIWSPRPRLTARDRRPSRPERPEPARR